MLLIQKPSEAISNSANELISCLFSLFCSHHNLSANKMKNRIHRFVDQPKFTTQSNQYTCRLKNQLCGIFVVDVGVIDFSVASICKDSRD